MYKNKSSQSVMDRTEQNLNVVKCNFCAHFQVNLPTMNIIPNAVIRENKIVTTEPNARDDLDVTRSHWKKTLHINMDIKMKVGISRGMSAKTAATDSSIMEKMEAYSTR